MIDTGSISNLAGVSVGNAACAETESGVTVVVFDQPAVTSIAIHGGAPGVRDTALLEPDATVDRVDAIVLSGGSAFGLDACGGVMAHLRASSRGYKIGEVRVPIVPGAVIFDLQPNMRFPETPLWWNMGKLAAASAASDFKTGSVGAGYGAITADCKGGLGTASQVTSGGFIVGVLVVVNSVGSPLINGGPEFWAGVGARQENYKTEMRLKNPLEPGSNTTLAIVATDAVLAKKDARRIAIMAHDGIALAIRPAHTPLDGDLVFCAGTGTSRAVPNIHQLTEIGYCAAACLSKAIINGIVSASRVHRNVRQLSYSDMFPER